VTSEPEPTRRPDPTATGLPPEGSRKSLARPPDPGSTLSWARSTLTAIAAIALVVFVLIVVASALLVDGGALGLAAMALVAGVILVLGIFLLGRVPFRRPGSAIVAIVGSIIAKGALALYLSVILSYFFTGS
jgi:hypothetical protein